MLCSDQDAELWEKIKQRRIMVQEGEEGGEEKCTCSHGLMSEVSEWHMDRGAFWQCVTLVLLVFSISMHAPAGKHPLP